MKGNPGGKSMEAAIQKLANLIDHLRLESLREQTRCFYCGGLHRTVDCASPSRDAFMMKLVENMNASKRTTQDSCAQQSDYTQDMWTDLEPVNAYQFLSRTWSRKSFMDSGMSDIFLVKKSGL